MLRGINLRHVGFHSNNNVNPSEPISEFIFRRLCNLGVDSFRIFLELSEASIWFNDNLVPSPTRLSDLYKHAIDGLDHILPFCQKYGRKLIICPNKLFQRSSGNVQHLYDFWTYLVHRYADNDYIVGYDLLNEPHHQWEIDTWWNEVAPNIINIIREVDASTDIILEKPMWSNPDSFRNTTPLQGDNLVYSIHMYEPHDWSHQKVVGMPIITDYYPGLIYKNVTWNKSEILKRLQIVRDFQLDNNVKILVGEFGATRWANGHEQYILDLIEIFDDYQWDWFFFGYGDWNGWNPTFDLTQSVNHDIDGKKDTPLLNLLKTKWKTNWSK